MDALLSIDSRFLNRAGLTWRALLAWWRLNPTDDHPTNGQLRDQLRALDLADVDERTIARGIADLAALGVLAVEPDRRHRVGRRIAWTPDNSVTPDRTGAPESSPQTDQARQSCQPSYVLRSNDADTNVIRDGRDKVVTPDNPVTPEAALPGTIAGGIASIADGVMQRLALAVGMERQPQLGFRANAPAARPTSNSPKLMQVLGRLDCSDCTDTDLQWAIARLAGEYGPEYRPFYRNACVKVRAGGMALATLIESVEEAEREGVKNRGAAFVAAVQRRRGAGTPTPGPNHQAHPGVGDRTVPDTANLTKTAV